MMNVTLAPRNATVEIGKQRFAVGHRMQNFLQAIESEVKNNPAKAKQWCKFLFKTGSMCVSMWLFGAPGPVVPGELTDLLIRAIITIVVVGVLLAMALSSAAGIWKMLFGKSRADDWTRDIIKGLLQVLAGPLVVLFVVAIFSLFFHNNPIFQPLYAPIEHAWDAFTHTQQ